jgi:hypothetical protein
MGAASVRSASRARSARCSWMNPRKHGEEDNHRDDHGLEGVTEKAGEQRRGQKDQDEGVAKLGGEGPPGRSASGFRELVGPVGLETRRGQRARESLWPRAESVQHIVGRHGMPGSRRLSIGRHKSRRY